MNASPDRTEQMSLKTMEKILSILSNLPPTFIDITGGAPELHPHLEFFLKTLQKQNHQIQLRTNLTILQDSKYSHYPKLYKELKIQLVASLPCYLEENVCCQRGEGVFEKSIKALQTLNSIGYANSKDIPLTLVFNPQGPTLPPPQKTLEEEYRQHLFRHYNIKFTKLIALTNMPLGRFLETNKENKQDYMNLLKQSFNPQTIPSLMCRHQINIGWDGTLYDCDFNLAAGIPVSSTIPQHIEKFNTEQLKTRKIKTGPHCFGCTAGAGSSCGGSLI